MNDVYLDEDANMFKKPDALSKGGKVKDGINNLSSKQYIQPCTGVTFMEPEKHTKETDLNKIPKSAKFIKRGPEYNSNQNAQKMSME